MSDLHKIAEINQLEIKRLESKIRDPEEDKYQKTFWSTDIVELKYTPKIYWDRFMPLPEFGGNVRIDTIKFAVNYYNQVHVQAELF